MMGMSLEMKQKQYCIICKHEIQNHRPDCPYVPLILIGKEIERGYQDCPKCHEKNIVLPNDADFLECLKCGTQFTRSEVNTGHDPRGLEKVVFLDYRRNRPFNALVLPEKGTGNIPLLRRERVLLEIKNEALKIAQEAEEKMKALQERIKMIEEGNGNP